MKSTKIQPCTQYPTPLWSFIMVTREGDNMNGHMRTSNADEKTMTKGIG